MIAFLWRRFIWFFITLFVVITTTFFLMRSVKGGPLDNERELPPAVKQSIAARYHLDWPWWRQYLQYTGPFNLDERRARVLGGTGDDPWGGILSWDFGPSFKYRDFSVNDIIEESLPISAKLGLVAMLFAISLGLTAGIVSALKRGTRIDLAMRLLATLGIALPNFIIAGFLVLLFVFWIPAFPVAGWGGLREMILPGFALGAPYAAYIARLTRTGMLEVLSQDYIRTAHAKGLPPRTVLLRHAIRGGIMPVVSYLGPAVAGVLTGSLVIERIFNIPGTGSHFINSALNRDYTLALGVTILYTVLVYTLNTLVDLAYTLLDPRIRLEEH